MIIPNPDAVRALVYLLVHGALSACPIAHSCKLNMEINELKNPHKYWPLLVLKIDVDLHQRQVFKSICNCKWIHSNIIPVSESDLGHF